MYQASGSLSAEDGTTLCEKQEVHDVEINIQRINNRSNHRTISGKPPALPEETSRNKKYKKTTGTK